MPRQSTGSVYERPPGSRIWYGVFTTKAGRKTVRLEHCSSQAEAEARKEFIAEQIRRLRAASRDEFVEKLLALAGPAKASDLVRIARGVDAIVAGQCNRSGLALPGWVGPCDCRGMANTDSNQDLIQGIDRLVREHIAATRNSALIALERAFGAEAEVASVRRRTKPSEGPKRRASSEVAALGERFYRTVCAKPGQTMTVLATETGASARELHRSVAQLKRAGRVRAVGHRSQTRYFPMASGTAAATA
jgi:hypothetical protein